jgi:hypothetical protein
VRTDVLGFKLTVQTERNSLEREIGQANITTSGHSRWQDLRSETSAEPSTAKYTWHLSPRRSVDTGPAVQPPNDDTEPRGPSPDHSHVILSSGSLDRLEPFREAQSDECRKAELDDHMAECDEEGEREAIVLRGEHPLVVER